MKAYLKPEDDQELKRMVKSLDMALALWDMNQWLRNEIKYSQKEHLQEARDELYRIMDDHRIYLDELIT